LTLNAWTSTGFAGGAAVLLLHGFGSAARETWVATGWTRTLERADIPWIAVDLPGHGRNPAEVDITQCTSRQMLASLRDLLDEHGAHSVSLLGYSFGGELALRFASAAPHLTARVAAGGVRANGLFTPEAVSDIHRHLQTGAEFENPLLAEAWAMTQTRGENDATAMFAFAAAAAVGPPLSDSLSFQGPAFLFRGAEDSLADTAEAFRDRLPSLEELVVPGRNHRNTLTARAVKQRVVAFLAENPA
jgi:pimeloyl-ACP methyl ester carboxylesterase